MLRRLRQFAPMETKQARALVIKCLKARVMGVDALRDIREALGQEQFGLVLEGLKDTEVKSILTRLDKHHPDMKEGSTGWRRQHLNALADGSSTPHAPPAKTKKAVKRPKPNRSYSEVVGICIGRWRKSLERTLIFDRSGRDRGAGRHRVRPRRLSPDFDRVLRCSRISRCAMRRHTRRFAPNFCAG